MVSHLIALQRLWVFATTLSVAFLGVFLYYQYTIEFEGDEQVPRNKQGVT